MKIIKNFNNKILKSSKKKSTTTKKEKYLKLKKKNKKYKLKIKNLETKLQNYLNEYNLQKQNFKAELKNKEDEILNKLLSQIASPLTQLNTAFEKNQTLDKGLKMLFQQIKNELQDFKVEFIGQVGEKVLYDETLHQPAGAENFNNQDKVEIVLEGIKLNGNLIKRAMVVKDK